MIEKNEKILNLDETIAKELFLSCDYPWEIIPKIHDYILKKIKTLNSDFIQIAENVYVHKTVQIDKKSTIIGPCIIDSETIVRPGAYIRGNAIIGKNSVVGNSTEIKNAILFNNVQCPHYNYVGDAILGYKAHMGAGSILSNVKSDKSLVNIVKDGEKISTNLKKFSAILGDNVEVGCNCVICPGTIIYPNTNIYPLTMVRGVIKENKIVKSMKNIVDKENL